MSTQKKIDELKLLYYQTTPGDWSVSDHLIVADDPTGKYPDIYIAEAVILDSDDVGRHDASRSYSNVKCLVASRANLPALLSVAEAAAYAMEAYKKLLEEGPTMDTRLAFEGLDLALHGFSADEPVQSNDQSQMTAS